jgi:hypothetical protein
MFYSLVHSKKNIPWENIVAFNSDNCSVMKGSRNGLIAKLREKQPNIIDVGCICHLANLAVASALKTGPFNIDDILCKIFRHFSLR